MSSQRIGGLACLIGGVVLFIVGMNASHSVTDRWSNLFTGHFTDATTWYLGGGIVLAIAGLIMLGASGRAHAVR